MHPSSSLRENLEWLDSLSVFSTNKSAFLLRGFCLKARNLWLTVCLPAWPLTCQFRSWRFIYFWCVCGPQETIRIVSHQQAKQLLNNKFVVVLGSSGKLSFFLSFFLSPTSGMASACLLFSCVKFNRVCCLQFRDQCTKTLCCCSRRINISPINNWKPK